MATDDLSQIIKQTVGEFIEDIRDNIFTTDKDQGELMMVAFFFDKMPATAVANHVIKMVLPYKKEIENREVSFFITKKSEIFKGLSPDRVDYFADLFQKSPRKGGISTENKEVVWSYFDTLLDLGERYKKNK